MIFSDIITRYRVNQLSLLTTTVIVVATARSYDNPTAGPYWSEFYAIFYTF